MPESEIQAAVEKAATETSTEETTETKVTAPEATEQEEESKPDPRTLQALSLLDALEDPRKAPQVVQNLMKQLGLSAPETRAEEKKAEKTIRDLVKDELGSDYEFLSDKLGSAIEKALSKIEEKRFEAERQKDAQVAALEYEKFIEGNKVTDDEAGEMMKLVDEMPWSGRGTLTNYLSKILKMHRAEVSEHKAEIAKRQKQQENFDKRPKTLGVEANEDRVHRGSKTVSVREAVEAAARGELLD